MSVEKPYGVVELLDEYTRIAEELSDESVNRVIWLEEILFRGFRFEAFLWGQSLTRGDTGLDRLFIARVDVGDPELEQTLRESVIGPSIPRIVLEGLNVLSSDDFERLWWDSHLMWSLSMYLLSLNSQFWAERLRAANEADSRSKTVEPE